MIELLESSGLPMQLDDDTGRLFFEKSIEKIEPAIRTRDQMRKLLWIPDAGQEDLCCYCFYKDVRKKSDTEFLKEHRLRYDVTVTMPGEIGKEWMKTAGHYHNFKGDSALTYPEVYEVIHGRALFLLQKADDPFAPVSDVIIEEVLLIEGNPGDVLVIPPLYGHLTINAGHVPLVVSDLISVDCQNIYDKYIDAGGGAYFIAKQAVGFDAVPNPSYRDLPGVRYFDSPSQAGLGEAGPVYPRLMQHPGSFQYLNNPLSKRK